MVVVHRKQLRRYEALNQSRFLTFSCCQRLPLFDNDAIKNKFVDHLKRSRIDTGFLLHGWVIMPEHVHLLLVPNLPEWSVSETLIDLKGKFSIEIIKRWKKLKAPVLPRLAGADGSFHFWQTGGGYDRNIRDEDERLEKIEYMHNNPVKRGLVATPVDWRWSSARWYAGVRDGELKMDSF